MKKWLASIIMGVSLLARAEEAPQVSAPRMLTVEGAQFRPLRLAMPAFEIEEKGEEGKLSSFAGEVQRVVKNDLEISGLFEMINPAAYPSQKEGILPAQVQWKDWELINTEGLVKAEVLAKKELVELKVYVYQLGEQRKYKLFDRRVRPGDAASVAHELADVIYEFFTGEKGFFRSKIIAVKTVGRNKHIVSMNIDGSGEKILTPLPGKNMLPTVSLDGKKILYIANTDGNFDLYEIRLDGTGRRKVSSYPGLNMGAVYSPDGSKIALTLSKEGTSQIYLITPTGNIIKKLTSLGTINVSPAFSPDGKKIAFVSNRSGGPQIFVMNAEEGSEVKRITLQGNYNQQPKWSPNGRHLVMTARDENKVFDLFLIEVETGKISRITQDQGRNEDPNFTPNGRNIIFRTERGGDLKGEIYISTLDGKVQKPLATKGDYESPSMVAAK